MSSLNEEPLPGAFPEDPGPITETSTQYSLSRAVLARKKEYVRRHRIRVKIGSWNVAACPGTDKDLASWFVDGKGLEKGADAHLARLHLNKSSATVTSNTETSTSKSSPSDLRPSNDDEGSIRTVGGSEVGLYVLGLQEIINLNLVSQSLYTDSSSILKWQAAIEAALPPDYKLIVSQQLSGILLLIYASPAVAATISDVSTVSVGTGLLGYMGNKGGVSSRIVLGETTSLVFTNCHLASGHDQANLDRRCWDYNRILQQTQFSPINHGGVLEDENQKIGDEDFAFCFGDLNFRLDGLPGDDIRKLLMLHVRGEYDLENRNNDKSLDGEEGVIILQNNDSKSGTSGDRGDRDESSDASRDSDSDTPAMVSRETSFDKDHIVKDLDDEDAQLPDPDDFPIDPDSDPASLQATINSLLPHDQLRRIIIQRKAFHEGWREGPISFLPTYKYDPGTVGLFDSSEKQRAPSWCDRILFRTRHDVEAWNAKCEEEKEAKEKDEDMKRRGIDEAGDEESVLFDIDDPADMSFDSTAGAKSTNVYDYDEYDDSQDNEGAAGEEIATKDEPSDGIHLDLYTTHQRITSSDHKPIVALFTVDYDAVVPELKARVHAEVARELDRAENEGRPCITIVVEGSSDSPVRQAGEGFQDNGAKHASEGVVHFGHVGFMRPPKHRTLTIANTGRVPATVTFVEKPNTEGGDSTTSIEPEWLQVTLEGASDDRLSPKSVTLEPGETASAHISISVTSLPHVCALNEGLVSLDDVLVLRVTDGRDHFVPVRADFLPSCFGRSVEELIRVPSAGFGIRGFVEKLKREKKDTDGRQWKGGSIPYSMPVQHSSPIEMYKLTGAVEMLTERVIAEWNMRQDENANTPRHIPGWPFVKEPTTSSEDDPNLQSVKMVREEYRAAIIEALETDQDLDSLPPPPDLTTQSRLEITARVLLLFLFSLTDGIVTVPLWGKIETALPILGSSVPSAAQAEEVKSTILDLLSAAPYFNISFVFVTSMLAKMASEVCPLSKAELDSLQTDPTGSQTRRSLGPRTLSFRKGSADTFKREGVNDAAIQRRLAWERKVAELFGGAIVRTGSGTGSMTAKEKKAQDDRMRGLVEVFVGRRDGL